METPAMGIPEIAGGFNTGLNGWKKAAVEAGCPYGAVSV